MTTAARETRDHAESTSPPSGSRTISPSHSAASGLGSGRNWLEEHSLDARLYPRTSVDGLAAAAILARRVGEEVSFINPYDKELDTTGPVVIVDHGVRTVHSRGPVLFVSRQGDAQRVKGTVVSDEQALATSLIAWRLVNSQADTAWLAALGILSEGGEEKLRATKLWTDSAGPLHRIRVLCKSAILLQHGPLRAAFMMLAESSTPQSALGHPAVSQLEAGHARLEMMLRAAIRVPPRIGPAAALVEIHVPAQLEGQIARAWARRLAPLPVVVANRGREPGRVVLRASCARQRPIAPWLDNVHGARSNWNQISGVANEAAAVMQPLAYDRFSAALTN